MEGKKIIFVSDRTETQRGVRLNDGRIVSLFDADNDFYMRYDYMLDLDNGVYYPTNEHIEGCTTLNSLIRSGKAEYEEVHCYDAAEYNEDVYPYDKDFTDTEITHIVDFFKKRGFNVTKDAVKHQISAWESDFKSGYLDKENGYHLFSPCGCNPLSIRLSTLHPLCSDWQKTYEC